MKHALKITLGSAAALFLTACAGTATGASKSALITSLPAPNLQQTAPDGTALVVLRYPAVVETDAQTAYRSNYLRTPIGGGGRTNASITNQDAQSIADGAIVKSNYFALSLYKELVERLPEHSVLLSPHAVTLAEDGTITSEPITQAENIASVLTLDFAAYSFPDPAKMMSGEALTFGDLITPLVTVRTRPSLTLSPIFPQARQQSLIPSPSTPRAGLTPRASILWKKFFWTARLCKRFLQVETPRLIHSRTLFQARWQTRLSAS